ncbi:MAG TPA: NAD-dependent epimerase/dehydratase family protein [Blastocatellia bacterium]|nr:NAD-dependent epimerase/dehydratase family protein [Blastocatellia bacterium]
MRRALITGGAGFIGSHLAQELLQRGEHVHVLDDSSSGDLSNIGHLISRPDLFLHRGSVRDEVLLAEIIGQCDTVYHLASSVGVKRVMKHSIDTIQNNVHGIECVLRQALLKNQRVVFASTSELYGNSSQEPLREDQPVNLGPPTQSRWSYAYSKALGESLALSYWRERHLPVVVIRLFNTVGPRQTGQYGMVIPTFVAQALRGEPITVYGDGLQSRTFGFVKDVVRGFADLASSDTAPGEIFNIGGTEETTIADLARAVKEVTGSPSDIVYIPYERAYGPGFADIRRRVPDLTKVSKSIGYRSSCGLRAILETVIRHERDRIAAAQSSSAASAVL